MMQMGLGQRFGTTGLVASVTYATEFAVSRASAASYLDAGLVLQSALAGVLRNAAYTTNLLDATVGPYLLIEAAATNEVSHPRDLTNAAWTKSASMATALNVEGIDGTANSATTLTASAANQTVTMPITLSAGEKTLSVWLKRVTGAGRIDITLDNGATWNEVTQFAMPNGGRKRAFATQTLANPTIGIRIVNSGDAIEVDAVQLESGGFATADILTGGATRAADEVSVTVEEGFVWDFVYPTAAQPVGDARFVNRVGFSEVDTVGLTANVLVEWFDPGQGRIVSSLMEGETIRPALNPELVVDGWFGGGTFSQDGTNFTLTNTPENGVLSDTPLTIGVEYNYVFEVTSLTSGAVRLANEFTQLALRTTVGVSTDSFTATSTQVRLWARNDITTATVTLSIREA